MIENARTVGYIACTFISRPKFGQFCEHGLPVFGKVAVFRNIVAFSMYLRRKNKHEIHRSGICAHDDLGIPLWRNARIWVICQTLIVQLTKVAKKAYRLRAYSKILAKIVFLFFSSNSSIYNIEDRDIDYQQMMPNGQSTVNHSWFHYKSSAFTPKSP